MLVARIRVCDVVVASFAASRVDADVGRAILLVVRATLAEGARSLVLDLGQACSIDASGALALGAASRALVARGGQLVISGLGPAARATVLSLFAGPGIELADAWTDGLEEASSPELRSTRPTRRAA